MLSEEETKTLKSQLKEQLSHLSSEQKIEAERQIDSMPAETIEAMLEKQKRQQRVFRLIVQGKIPSVKIAENSEAIAVLSTKAISKAHFLVIPKIDALTSKGIPKAAFELAEELGKKIIKNLKASSTRIETESAFGESVINVIPIYDKNLDLSSERTQKSLEDLEKLKKEIETEQISLDKKFVKIKTKKEKPSQKPLSIDRRIP
jgi:diadenosine tetraphosphate (Ap4A) HIT family hydrolase